VVTRDLLFTLGDAHIYLHIYHLCLSPTSRCHQIELELSNHYASL
jgi:hypothetical protein